MNLVLDATAERSNGPDKVLMVPTRFGSGFFIPSTSSHMMAALTASLGVLPSAKTPWFCMMIAGERWSPSTRTSAWVGSGAVRISRRT